MRERAQVRSASEIVVEEGTTRTLPDRDNTGHCDGRVAVPDAPEESGLESLEEGSPDQRGAEAGHDTAASGMKISPLFMKPIESSTNSTGMAAAVLGFEGRRAIGVQSSAVPGRVGAALAETARDPVVRCSSGWS